MAKEITIKTVVNAPIENIWEFWTSPQHITKWNYASDDWETPSAKNDVRIGGRFNIRMSAKNKSAGFDFTGRYTNIQEHKLIEYDIDDGRHVKIEFAESPKGVQITETFEMEKTNPEEMQRSGWQTIMDNFKKYAEAQAWIKKLEQEGFTDIRVCPIPPNQDLPEHTHDQHTVHIILSGELMIADAKGSKIFKSGDRVEFPAGTAHKARGATSNGTMITGVKANQHSRQKIIPHLWFDKEAKEAAAFYASVFPQSKVKSTTVLHNTPSGDCDVVQFQVMGYDFMAISAGPYFKCNPSISFHVKCRTVEEVDEIWKKLSKEGIVRMELGEYPFSKRYGWIEDKYGVSWQVIYAEGDFTQRVIPALMFVGKVCGKAEEAINFYTSIFPNAKSQVLARYGKGEKPDKEGTVKYAQFMLNNQEFGAMDSAHKHDFAFNEAISFIVHCDTQEEIDYYWKKLSTVPEAEQCGWLKDKFGVSWQIVPSIMEKMLKEKDEKKMARITEAFLKMKKFDIEALKKAAK